MAELFSLTRRSCVCRIDRMDQNEQNTAVPPEQAGSVPAPRPISERKLAANRKNALLSTGPRTARGKARSSMNALKHGMLTRRLVIAELEGETAARDFRTMMAGLTADLRPMGALENLMVQEIGVCAWRIRRVLKYENRAAFLNSHHWKAPISTYAALSESMLGSEWQRHSYNGDEILADYGLNDLSMPERDEMMTISRYESSLVRHLYRAIDKLEHLQHRRRVAAAEGDEHARANERGRSHRGHEIIEHFRGR
jgi:hypothetical protein